MNLQNIFVIYNITSGGGSKHNIKSGWLSVNCPECFDSNFTGAFNISNGVYNCFRCGKNSGPLIFSKLANISLFEAKNIFKSIFKNSKFEISKEFFNKNVKEVMLPGSKFFFEKYKKYKNYLESRLVPYEKNDWRNLQATDILGDWPNSLIIPIYYKNRLVTWQAKSLFNTKQKYISCSEDTSIVSIKNILYGRYPEKDVIGVCEGVFDVWSLGDKFVCTFGSTLSDYQLQQLAQKKRVFFAFDNDDSKAQEKAKNYCERLVLLGVDAINLFWDGSDPNDLPLADRKLLANEVR